MNKGSKSGDDDELRPEYDVSQLKARVRGKYFEQDRARSPALLWTALACGIIPLTVGSAIYFSFRAARLDWLAVAGIYTILGGLAFVAVGITCLIAYAYRRRDFSWRTLLVGLLLLSNFPAAAIYGLSAIDLLTRYVVQVVNASGTRIDSFILNGGGVEVELGPIESGEKKHCHLYFRQDGTLMFTARQEQRRVEGVIDDYVTSNLGGEAVVHLKPAGQFEIRHED